MNKLTIAFTATEYNGWPSLRFCINDDVQQEVVFTESELSVTLDLELFDGSHVLEIERYGKTDANVNFVNNEILADQTVTLVDFYIDNVQLPDTFKYQGTFFYNDCKIPSGLVWGPNGKFIWHFETPILNWVIGQRKKNTNYEIDLFGKEPDDINRLLQQLTEFENLLLNDL
jgi:hypothetical protein